MTTIQTHPLNPTKNMIGLGYKLWVFLCYTGKKRYRWGGRGYSSDTERKKTHILRMAPCPLRNQSLQNHHTKTLVL